MEHLDFICEDVRASTDRMGVAMPMQHMRYSPRGTSCIRISQGQRVREPFENHTNWHMACILHNNYCIPQYTLEIGRRQFVYRGPKVWKLVPDELKLVENVKIFRTGIRALWQIDGDPGIT